MQCNAKYFKNRENGTITAPRQNTDGQNTDGQNTDAEIAREHELVKNGQIQFFGPA